MKYYRITCHTPFVGEENDYYIATESRKELEAFIDECVYENGNEWYDEQSLEEQGMTEDEYYAECGVTRVDEITADEFYEACPWEV
jgi:hypothetical protein